MTCAEAFATAARRHGEGGIENARHWVLDVTFREDSGRVRKGHTSPPSRKFALALSRRDETYLERGLRSRRKTAECLPLYRASLLGLVQKSQMRWPWKRENVESVEKAPEVHHSPSLLPSEGG